MKHSELVVRAFNGSRKTVIGEVDLPTKIGPHTFFITLFKMDIYPMYSYLLRRPWIHSPGAVTLTIHQRLKSLVHNKLVVMEGEEDIIVNHRVSFRYIEGGGEVHETPFQSFEVVNVEMVSPMREENKTEFPIISLEYAETVIKNGHPEG